MRLRRTLAILIALLALLPTPMSFASGGDVIRDCTDDERISGKHSQADYRKALETIPSDVDQYYDCSAQIRNAMRSSGLSSGSGGSGGGGDGAGGGTGGSGGGGGGGGGGGSLWGGGSSITGVPDGTDPLATITPKEKAELERTIATGGAPLALDGRPVTPGSLGGTSLSEISDLPVPLLLLLALCVLGGLAAAARTILIRVKHHRATPTA